MTNMTVTFTKSGKHHRASYNLIVEADKLMKLPLINYEVYKNIFGFYIRKETVIAENLAKIDDSLLVIQFDLDVHYTEVYYDLKQFRSLEVGSVVTMSASMKNLIDEWSFDED